ncbi:MAG TPA: UDP-N-acetylmuramoylalanyl-D-glutamyl-2,6-diaminopimelate--D-alanyl-D-alanine ligase [Hyphomicrobiaceae bacterium]|nr:UDP-N-acetylmuramoylalanyl-D-glutamyl-2,6-diaminopimelate--D-alanyl-D-alanine ligase [Hyphomicrobiaceae bacterium]
MTDPLWQWDELVAATHGRPEGTPAAAITGFSIDTRTLQPGDVFVALNAARDGHEFVTAAFAAGAAAALVSSAYARTAGDGALLRVAGPLAALEAIGRAARARSAARIVAVTGSAGKTGTKEMLRLSLRDAGRTHASEKSYNNHWGVPLTLARMPRSAEYGVFEIGMNHAGEILPLTRLVRPHVAVITTVEPVHLEYFASVEAIAEAKAEIFAGIEPGGTAVLPYDNPHFALLKTRAAAVGARVASVGYADAADVHCIQANMDAKGASVIAGVSTQRFPYRVGAPGEHYVRNSLAVLAALLALGADPMRCLPALVQVTAPAGRGARTTLATPEGPLLLIDESYNANPASARAALAAMATVPRADFRRRIAVLGDMLELGDASGDLHRGLKEAVDAAGIDLVFACGPMMKLLFDELKTAQQGAWAQDSAQLSPGLLDAVQAGDVVMIKGSLASRMGPLAEAMRTRFPKAGG